MPRSLTNHNVDLGLTNNKSKIVAFILIISFILQYNFLFSAEYLWLNYWSGADIRTTISFTSIVICLLILSFEIDPRKVNRPFAGVILFYFTYCLVIGMIRNELSVGMVAEAVFWIEIVLYMIVFASMRYESLNFLVRIVIYYSAINAILSILYFWTIRDQIAVAALVGDQRVVRVADLLAPMVLLLYILYNTITPQKKLAILWALPLVMIVMLGMFRSVWAALILSYVLSNLIFANTRGVLRMGMMGVAAVLFIFIFEYVFSYFFGVENVISGRILAGVGTEDSLGRISSAGGVLDQLFDEPLSVIFGAGFGRLVWFVNDFGYGEIYALQPLGSLSNYYVVLVFQAGIFVTLFFFLYALGAIRNIVSSYEANIAKVLLLIVFYFLAQWLTFPTTIHYPVAAIIALYFGLAAMYSRNTKRV